MWKSAISNRFQRRALLKALRLATHTLGCLAILLSAACTVTAPNPAVNTPDHFAWQLFIEVNQLIPDDPQGRVLWESWALASDVFDDPHATPDWDTLTSLPRSMEQLDRIPLQLQLIDADNNRDPDLSTFDPEESPAHGNETRMNRATFDFIVTNELWYVEGQEAFFARNTALDFPPDAREVKAQWRRIDDPQQAGRYHTATLINAAGEEELWGLTSLHITTKDLPNWFWATWEHMDNPGREDVVPSRDRAGLPAALQGTKWENYVLRGSQIDFVDPTGRPTILASSQIEAPFQSTSSCITCHARATIGSRQGTSVVGNRLSVFVPFTLTMGSFVGYVGAPDPEWFYDTSTEPDTRKYAQLDFVWSLFRAERRNP